MTWITTHSEWSCTHGALAPWCSRHVFEGKKGENHRAKFSGETHTSVVHAKIIFVSLRWNIFFWNCFIHFSKATAPNALKQAYFKGSFLPSLSLNRVSLILICGCLCFVSYKKYPDLLNFHLPLIFPSYPDTFCRLWPPLPYQFRLVWLGSSPQTP